MPTFASRSVFVVGRTAPALLTQSPNQGDMLVYDDQLGVFINKPGIGTNGSGAINLNNTGSGVQLATAGTSPVALNVKSLVAGNNITLSDTGSSIIINSSGGSGPSNSIGVLYMQLAYNSGTTNLITIPAGGIILNTEVAVMTPFDGSPTFSIGTATTPNLLVDNSNVDLTSSISYKNDITFIIPGVGNQTIQAFMTSGGATEGVLSVFIEYSATSSIVPVANASVVNDIADRNELVPVIGQFVYVLDDGTGEAATQLWTGASWVTISTSNSATDDAHTFTTSINYATSSTPIYLGTVEPGTHVVELEVDITSGFSGSPSFTLGTMTNPTLVSSGSGVIFGSVSNNILNPDVTFAGSSELDLYLFFNNGSATIGSANFSISVE